MSWACSTAPVFSWRAARKRRRCTTTVSSSLVDRTHELELALGDGCKRFAACDHRFPSISSFEANR
jgi:hypothetical protein